MKVIQMLFMWPIIFAICWYFFGFEIAIVIGFLYLHFAILALFNYMEKQKNKLIEIVEHIASKEGIDNEPLTNIFTGEKL